MNEWHQLNIYVGEANHWKQQSLHAVLVETAHAHGLAGATVTREIAGFGEKARIRTTNTLASSTDLPVVVTIVDQAEMIAQFIPVVQSIVQTGLITLQPVSVIEPAINSKQTSSNRPKFSFFSWNNRFGS
ncbi:DUF190 domain-containing protein [Leptolyngbya sp. DQ-M1]|uniref:DUF190 domain-containing protein n=1 Tax=Leptolyngbya sp. DQ-M1 TaxID=2933920 RepID=UPI003298491C